MAPWFFMGFFVGVNPITGILNGIGWWSGMIEPGFQKMGIWMVQWFTYQNSWESHVNVHVNTWYSHYIPIDTLLKSLRFLENLPMLCETPPAGPDPSGAILHWRRFVPELRELCGTRLRTGGTFLGCSEGCFHGIRSRQFKRSRMLMDVNGC